MLSQSWDGTRVYFTSSLLANWDKPVMVPTEVEVKDEEGNPTGEMQTINASNDGVAQYLKAYSYDGSSLSHKFTVNFGADGLKLGMPHLMRFGAYSLYAKSPKDGAKVAELSK